jgi:DNA-binding MarR family transcriptional regulator
VSNLEEAAMVRRTPDEADKRQVRVELTAAARDLIVANRRRRDEWLQTKLKTLTPQERDILRKAAPVLERLAAS